MSPIITLLTDFGISDGYVASMKGVILGICPEARLVDVSHLVPPQDIRAGAFLLSTVYRDFPEGTIHLAVVDPGVGTERRALAIRASCFFFVGPDNGLFSLILRNKEDWEAYSLEDSRFWRSTVSSTFHGRDIFAPVAAHLAKGTPVNHFGPLCAPLIASWSSAIRSQDGIQGEVIYIDHFGNAVTNLTHKDLETLAPQSEWSIRVRDLSIPAVGNTYGDAEPGAAIALIGSSGYLEIAVNGDHAAKALNIQKGDPVLIRYLRHSVK